MLSPAVEENRRNQDQEKGSTKLQCLKCKQEFLQSLAPWHQGSYPSEVGDVKILETLVASDQGRMWSPGKGCLLMPRQAARMAAVVQSVECIGEGDAFTVLQ